MSDSNFSFYWQRTRKLMLASLAVWTICAICIPLLIVPLNRITVSYLDAPLGFFLASQGGLIIFLVITWAFVRRQDRIDRDHFSDVGR